MEHFIDLLLPDVIGRVAAASADDVDEAVAGKVAQVLGRHFRRLVVAAERVGQT